MCQCLLHIIHLHSRVHLFIHLYSISFPRQDPPCLFQFSHHHLCWIPPSPSPSVAADPSRIIPNNMARIIRHHLLSIGAQSTNSSPTPSGARKTITDKGEEWWLMKGGGEGSWEVGELVGRGWLTWILNFCASFLREIWRGTTVIDGDESGRENAGNGRCLLGELESCESKQLG